MKSTLYKQNCLIDLVKRVPLDRVFLSTPTSSYTYSDVVELSDNLRSNYSQLANKNCAIISDDRESLALLLPAIDSICGSVFLLPKDAEGHEEIFYQSADIHYVINLSAGKVSDVKVVSDQQPTQNEQVKTYILATSGTTGTPKLASYSLGFERFTSPFIATDRQSPQGIAVITLLTRDELLFLWLT